MSFCQKCGKQLPEGVTVCECENGVQAQNVTPEAPATVTPVTAPAPQFVAPMVNNAPVGSFSVTSPVSNGDYEGEYFNAVKDCKIINILSIVLFLVGVVSVLFLNEWIAAALFLVGELFALFPNEKLMKLCKVRNPGVDKKTQNKIVKETKKRIKAKNVHFKFSFIIAYVCLACLIISFIVPVPLLAESKNNSTDNNDYEDVAANNDDYKNDISDEGYKKVEAVSFITGSNFKIYEAIKPYCQEIGYDVDSWVVDTNTKDSLLLFGPEYSSEGQMVMVMDSSFVVQMKKSFLVTGDGNKGFITIVGRGSEEEYVFGFVDALLADCPEELKYSGQYLRDNYNDNANKGTAEFEKEGITYQVTYLPNTNGWCITLRLAEG